MRAKREVRFGIIGGGLMGREFASAVARWCHLLDQEVQPRITGICDANPAALEWFQNSLTTIEIATTDYHELLTSPNLEAIYCAVPHNLHAEIYADIIAAGKHLLGEKPFGIDFPANQRILEAVKSQPEVLVRCSSELPFYPGAQKIVQFVREGRFGNIIEVQSGFLHSSDLDPHKPINWKRRIASNGVYGCMGDLGMHALHIPLRMGWYPQNLRAVLSKIVSQRPGPDGHQVPCETWDNATLLCEVTGDQGQADFPMTIETKRIAPGEANTMYIRVLGTAFSAEFSTKYPKTLKTLPYTPGGEQAWHWQDLGSQSVYPTITGAIFEFGFSDSILQMWAAFLDELVHGPTMRGDFGCATPEEARQTHNIFTAALASNELKQVVEL